MATIRVKDITTDADNKLVSGDKFVIDSSGSGTRSIDYDDLKHIFNGENSDVFDGTDTDYSGVIQGYIDAGRSIKLPRGTIRIDNALSADNTYGLFLEGAGENRTILDTTLAGSFTYINNSVIYCAGSAEQIEDLANSPEANSRLLVFSSAPDLSADDTICVYDDTSESTWSAFRSYYRDGQFFNVTSVDGVSVNVAESVARPFPTTASIYKIDAVPVTIRDLTIQCVSGDDSSVGLRVTFGKNTRISNVSVYSNGEKSVQLDRNHGFTINNLYCRENGVDSNGSGTDYGLAISNSSNGQINGGIYKAVRHGITIGGGSSICSVVCRNLNFENLYVGTVGTSTWAGDVHGNAEFVTYNNVFFDGGINFGGSNTKITNSTLIQNPAGQANQIPIYLTELYDMNHTIENCVMEGYSSDVNRGLMVDVGGNDVTTMNNHTSGGIFTIRNNKMTWEGEKNNKSAIYVYNRGLTASDFEVHVEGNTFLLKDDSKPIGNFFSYTSLSGISGVETKNLKLLNVSNNHAQAGGPSTDGQGSLRNYVDTFIHKNNYYYNSENRVIAAGSLNKFCLSQGNTYDTMHQGGTFNGETSGGSTATIILKDETFRNCFERGNDSGSDAAVLRVIRAKNVIARNIDIFNDNEKMNIDNLSEVDYSFLTTSRSADVVIPISGATATASITGYVSGASVDNIFIGTSRSGEFTLSETLSFTNTDAGSTVTVTLCGLPEPAHQHTLYGVSLSSFRYSGIYDSSISGVEGRSIGTSNVGTLCAE